jgi:hypothetical protein
MTANRTWLRRAVLAAFCVAGAAQAAELTIFKQPNFTGDALTLHDDAATLANRNFHDQASSVVVKSGRWQLCTQPNFQGDCVILDRGEYAALDQRLNHRVESAREVTRMADAKDYRYPQGRPRDDRYASDGYRGDRAPGYGYRQGPAVVLYDGPDFSGRAVRVQNDMPSLYKRGFDDRASSMVIHEGAWQICTDEGYEGRCRVFQPGEYADLRGFDNRIASLKRVG